MSELRFIGSLGFLSRSLSSAFITRDALACKMLGLPGLGRGVHCGGAAGSRMRSAVAWHVVRTERARFGWLGWCAGIAPYESPRLKDSCLLS